MTYLPFIGHLSARRRGRLHPARDRGQRLDQSRARRAPAPAARTRRPRPRHHGGGTTTTHQPSRDAAGDEHPAANTTPTGGAPQAALGADRRHLRTGPGERFAGAAAKPTHGGRMLR